MLAVPMGGVAFMMGESCRVPDVGMPEHIIKTKHGELTLEELAEIQPGMARLMDELARRWQYAYYAAKGGNWDLARHELKQVASLLNIASKLRPKYRVDIKGFSSKHMTPIAEAIERRDWKRFKVAVDLAIDASNVYHEKYGYRFIRYVLPKTPPEHLDFGPQTLGANRANKKPA